MIKKYKKDIPFDHLKKEKAGQCDPFQSICVLYKYAKCKEMEKYFSFYHLCSHKI